MDFASAASAFAVCGYCRSSVVREGEALRSIGRSAELFDDHTPLQLGVNGSYQGAAFTLIGRLQFRSAEGTWNEWHALFDGGDSAAGGRKSGWLSEDNGRYVLAFDAPLTGTVPPAQSLRPGMALKLAGQAWAVASVTLARLIAAQGELVDAPNSTRAFIVADLRNSAGEVATLDYSDDAQLHWSIGRSVALDDLALSGLAEGAEKTLKARGLECPSCGASLVVQLATTKSIACPQCHAVVDLSSGVGAALQHYAQTHGAEPQIPLGSTGTFTLDGDKALPWQVVGYVERCEVIEVEEDSDGEQVFWREYLLYHRNRGFAFLVDAEDGWSWTVPITGVPERAGEAVRYRGVLYRKLYDYTGKVTYVLGEFYWRLEREQRSSNTDYRGTGRFASRQLSCERTGQAGAQEIIWSAGEAISSQAVLNAFKLAPDKAQALRRDAMPTSGNAASLLAKLFFGGLLAVPVLLLFQCDSADDCTGVRSSYGEASNEYRNCLASQRSSSRTGGGSWGGFSSGGGGHK
ncbi:MAG: DUF4178 domain-containing protein [Burkholderiaceae bacterium]